MEDQSPLHEDPPYRTRIDILFARDAPKAVLLRRGPKRHFHLIEWDLKTDRFTYGQWMKASELRLCDLSPDGGKLVYWAAQYHASAPRHIHAARHLRRPAPSGGAEYDPLLALPTVKSKRGRRKVPRYLRGGSSAARSRNSLKARKNEGVWTAISTPPFFSALAIWPSFGHWTGGGVFTGDKSLILFEPVDGLVADANVPVPGSFRIASFDSLPRTGKGFETSAYNPARKPNSHQAELAGHLQNAGTRWVEWVTDRSGDLLFACDGCIYRLADWKKIAPEALLSSATLLADLRSLHFAKLVPPHSAMQW